RTARRARDGRRRAPLLGLDERREPRHHAVGAKRRRRARGDLPRSDGARRRHDLLVAHPSRAADRRPRRPLRTEGRARRAEPRVARRRGARPWSSPRAGGCARRPRCGRRPAAGAGRARHGREPGGGDVGARAHRDGRPQARPARARRHGRALVAHHPRQRARHLEPREPPLPPGRGRLLRPDRARSRLGPRVAGGDEARAEPRAARALRPGARRVSPPRPAPDARDRRRDGARSLPSDGRRRRARGRSGRRAARRAGHRRPRLRRRQGDRRRRRRRPARPAPPLGGRARPRRARDSPAVGRDRRRTGPRVARRRPRRARRDQPRIAHRPDRGEGGGPSRTPSVFQALGPPSRDPPLRHGDVVDGGARRAVVMGAEEATRAPRARRQAAVPGEHLLREAEAISAGAVAVFLALSFVSYVADAPRANLGGAVGHALAGAALRALGIAAYLFPVYLGYFTVAVLRRDATGSGGVRLAGAGLLVGTVATFAGLATGGRAVVHGGGWLGGFVAVALADLLGGPGTFLLLSVVLVLALVLATGVSAFEVAGAAGRWIGATVRDGLDRARAKIRGPHRKERAAEPARTPPRAKPPILLD